MEKDKVRPPSSIMNDCYDYKQKNEPQPRQQDEKCLVCGAKASGYHYNALTCDACKDFFRQSIIKNRVYQCNYDNKCDIDIFVSRKCQECRLKKCLSVRMRPESVVPEYQCAIKRETKNAQNDKDETNSTTRDSGSDNDEKSNGSLHGAPQSKALNESQLEIISRLVELQEYYESPSKDDFKKVSAFPLGDSEKDSMKRFQHITEITFLYVQLFVEFSKRVPGFDELSREDQNTLLKACSNEVMMLITARKYDHKTDSITFENNQQYTRENYRSACMGDSTDSIFNFCKDMCDLKVDNAEYALLKVIVLFSNSPSLLDAKKVEETQEFYNDTLRDYIAMNQAKDKNYFASLLSTLEDLRTLGKMQSELCLSFDQNRDFLEFLENWGIQQ